MFPFISPLRLLFRLPTAFGERRFSSDARVALIIAALFVQFAIWAALFVVCYFWWGWTVFMLLTALTFGVLGGVWFLFILVSQVQRFNKIDAGLRLAVVGLFVNLSWFLPIVGAMFAGILFEHQFLFALIFAALWFIVLALALPFMPIWMFERLSGEVYLRVPVNSPQDRREFVRRKIPSAHGIPDLINQLTQYGVPKSLMHDYIEFGVPDHLEELIRSALQRHLDEREIKLAEEKTDQALIQSKQQGQDLGDTQIGRIFEQNLQAERAVIDPYEAAANKCLEDFFTLTKVEDSPILYINPTDKITKVWELTTRIFSGYRIERIPSKDGPQFALDVEFGLQFNPVRAKDAVLSESIRKSAVDEKFIRDHIRFATLNQLQAVTYKSFSEVPLQEVHVYAIRSLPQQIAGHLKTLYDNFGITLLTPTIICQPEIKQSILDTLEQAALAKFIGHARNAEFWDLSDLIRDNPDIQHLLALRYVRSVRMRGNLTMPGMSGGQLPPARTKSLPDQTNAQANTVPAAPQPFTQPTPPFVPPPPPQVSASAPSMDNMMDATGMTGMTGVTGATGAVSPRPKAAKKKGKKTFKDFWNEDIIPMRRGKDGVYRAQPNDEDE